MDRDPAEEEVNKATGAQVVEPKAAPTRNGAQPMEAQVVKPKAAPTAKRAQPMEVEPGSVVEELAPSSHSSYTGFDAIGMTDKGGRGQGRR